jgi:uncharacterized protein (DUF488 family)
MDKSAQIIYTVGHSTHPIDTFIRISAAYKITLLADVRTIPHSRHNPQFNQDSLASSLGAAGIAYRHMSGLGGLRKPRSDSPNTSWRNASFRGYADYMQTQEFEKSLQELIGLAERETVVIMCAEALPWRCHRSLIADALTARGIHVEHILSESEHKKHELNPMASIEGTRIIYPGLF